MKIKEVHIKKAVICRRVLEQLPQWFGIAKARENYISKAEQQTMLACFKNGQSVAMLSLLPHSYWNLEISVMGVLPEFHRQGIGSLLLNAAKQYAAMNRFHLLTVKTIAPPHSDPFYAKTRAFYHSNGFELFEIFPDLWGENAPCGLYVYPISDAI